MKTNSIISGIAACLIAISLTACDKAKDDLSKAADSAKDAAGKAVDATKDATAAAVTNVVATAAGPVGEAIAAAKKALDEKNYQGALDELKKLSDVQLSPEQQNVVDGLKAEATKLLSGAAAALPATTDAAKALAPKQ